jgi:uncharacterized protein (TIGR03382 family)
LPDSVSAPILADGTSADVGVHRVVIIATNAVSFDRQEFEVEVSCGEEGRLAVACGCGATDATPSLLLVAWMLLVARRRLRQ